MLHVKWDERIALLLCVLHFVAFFTTSIFKCCPLFYCHGLSKNIDIDDSIVDLQKHLLIWQEHGQSISSYSFAERKKNTYEILRICYLEWYNIWDNMNLHYK